MENKNREDHVQYVCFIQYIDIHVDFFLFLNSIFFFYIYLSSGLTSASFLLQYVMADREDRGRGTHKRRLSGLGAVDMCILYFLNSDKHMM